MSEKRLQEIKDSVEFQYTLAKAKGYDNALLFTNEEEELIEEIERLHSIIKEAIEYINEKADYPVGYYHCLKELRDILKGVEKSEFRRL